MHPKKIIREYLDFSYEERKTIFALVALSILAIFIPTLISAFKPEHKASTEKLESIKKLIAMHDSTESNSGLIISSEDELFYFDPNIATKEELISLGINEKIADRIIKYRSAGGKFISKEDMLRVYGFTQNDFEKLEPFIVFHTQGDNLKNQDKAEKEFEENLPITQFDPNKISKEEWVHIGIKEYIADRIIKYTSKGGKFNSAEDILKIYGFHQTDFERLKDYMVFENEKTQEQKLPEEKKVISEKQITEINSATKDQLLALGFSNYNANGIITYREGLGGFYSSDQLKDVYKIDLQVLNEAISYIKIDQSKIQKININTGTFEQLEKHAYISDDVAKAIIDYRNASGKFIVMTELQKIKGVYPALFEKLKPYLTL